MFEDIPQNGWQHSMKCLRHIFVCLFGEMFVCLYFCEMFVWCIASAKSLNKVKNLQKWALHFLHNECSSSCEELLKKPGRSTVNVSSYRSLCTEIFKIPNDINPSFIKDIFMLRMANGLTRENCKLNMEIPKSNQVRFGTKSLRYLGPKVRNSLPYHIKSSENLSIFKTLIKNWNGTVCSCKTCKKWNYTLSASFLPL